MYILFIFVHECRHKSQYVGIAMGMYDSVAQYIGLRVGVKIIWDLWKTWWGVGCHWQSHLILQSQFSFSQWIKYKVYYEFS